MALNPDHLLKRSLVVDRNRNIAFFRLYMTEAARDVLMPIMLKLANLDNSRASYLFPLVWFDDPLLLKKLPINNVLLTIPSGLGMPLVVEARKLGYRIAVDADHLDGQPGPADFHLLPAGNARQITPSVILTGIDNATQFNCARDVGGLYFDGQSPMDTPVVSKPSINPAHATVLQLIGAVRQDAEPREIEALFKQDVTLSFKLLRYINSPFFGLNTRVDSVRHALAILGSQQLAKWLTLLAATAGSGTSPALTQNAMIRARMMELLGARMEKRDQDDLFITGMFSLLDRIMQTPLAQLLERAKLPEAVIHALLENEGRYAQMLALARVCEGEIRPDEATLADIDPKTANLAHLDAIEWAMQIAKAE